MPNDAAADPPINKMDIRDPERAWAKQEHIVVRLGDELDRLLKLGKWLRECLENSLYDGLGYKQMAIPKGAVQQYKDLATTMDSVVKTKIAFDKAAKILAENMTPDEEMKAVIKYLKATSPDVRKAVFKEIRDWAERKPSELRGDPDAD